MPLHEDHEDEDVGEDRPALRTSSHGFTPQYEDSSPRLSETKLVIETETSPIVPPSNVPPSPPSAVALSNAPSTTRGSDDSNSPQIFPTRLSVASRIPSERSPLAPDFVFPEVDEPRSSVDPSTKRVGDGASTSTWEKVKSTFTGGRRSRTNSILTREKRDHTESSISRESGASIASAKTGDGPFANQAVVMQAPSASASILSLPAAAPRGGVSPVPPASSADLLKYQDAKLFPFPGMKMLEEQRNRARACMSASASSPDIVMSPQTAEAEPLAHTSSSSSNTSSRTPEVGRDRKLSHQASDTRLISKYNSPPVSATPSSSSHAEYFSPFSTPATSALFGIQSTLSKLPTNREGVRKWLNAKKLFSSQSSSPNVGYPTIPPNAAKKPSLSDLLKVRKDDLTSEWEETGSDKARTPTSANTVTTSTFTIKQVASPDTPDTPLLSATNGISQPPRDYTDQEKTPKGETFLPAVEPNAPSQEILSDVDASRSLPTPPEHPSSTTPDPTSSVEGFSGRSTSASSSTPSSQYSARNSAQGAIVLERLDDMLGRGSRSPMWASAIDDPPRKLLLTSPVLQIVNPNTVKDRFLFLFSDILVIAKPIEQENLLDLAKPNPLDRKFVVKNVVLLRNLRFTAEREDHSENDISASPRQHIVRTFVHQFAKDPDMAISALMERTGCRDDPTALGQFLFRTLDIDRARLGDYLSRRTSRLVLKSYIDSFGFTGLSVDKALRTFLLSIHIPPKSAGNNALDYLLDAFAIRWYEANAPGIIYDKDAALRLVRAIIQLNDAMYGGVSSEPGIPDYPNHDVTSRSFLQAFRRYDARGLVPDDVLEDIYNSMCQERLSQARAQGGPPDILISIKRPPPPRLTYKVQSEPIILRIPQPDPKLTVLLHGQGLLFDPPVLTFAKSPEASFRVTGTSLGPKTMIMRRSGSNALAYSGLPLNSSVVIERAFMRNTFQIAFANRQGVKRRYMFSVDDPLIRHEWTVSLKRQIEAASASTLTLTSSGTSSSKFHRAAESTAFKVLQQILLGPYHPSLPDLENGALRISSPTFRHSRGNSQRNGGPLDGITTKPSVVRSKSRSKVYYRRHGPGKLEMELNLSDDESRDSRDFDDDAIFKSTAMFDGGPPSSRLEIRCWSGRDLEMQCQQNSSIALVLAYLQVGSPDHSNS
jgi:serine/arginine repetitive matrix protein 2